MKRLNLISNLLFLTVLILAGCGSDGGGGSASNAPASVELTVSKGTALANNSDSVNILANIKKADGSLVPDGTPITFTVPDNNGVLSAATATTLNGTASASLTHAPIFVANNLTVTVTCLAGSISGKTDVKFINQPATADVFIAFNQPVANLAALNFNLINTAGATFDSAAQPQQIFAMNNAAGSIVLGNFTAATNTTAIGLVNANGFNTGTAPIIKVVFAVTPGATLPSFSIDQTPANFKAADSIGGATTPLVTAADMVIVKVAFDTEL